MAAFLRRNLKNIGWILSGVLGIFVTPNASGR